MNFGADGIYDALLQLSAEEGALDEQLAAAKLTKRVASSILAVLAVTLGFLAAVSTTNYWQSVLLELASANAFFVAVPLFFAVRSGERKRKVVRTLVVLAAACLAGAYWAKGFWQSTLVEVGVGFLSVAALDIVIRIWLEDRESRIAELERELAAVKVHLPR